MSDYLVKLKYIKKHAKVATNQPKLKIDTLLKI